MDYQIINVEFKIWAQAPEEGALLQRAFTDFINEHAAEGRRVTAAKVADAVGRWKQNAIVRTQVINYFRN